MVNVEQTIAAQYSTSATIVQLVRSMNGYIDAQADLDNFLSYVWNIKTAQGFGLDILGRIVGVSRQLQIPLTGVTFGFKEGLLQPFGQAPFFPSASATNTYLLTDTAYRTLILFKALLNISNGTAPAINQLLKNLFAGRGRCYVTDTGQMQIRFVFEFPLLPYELAILTQSNAVPRPAAVQAQVMQLDLAGTFGFKEAGVYQPFGQGVFFNSTTGLINAN